jgi:hypothetical protein
MVPAIGPEPRLSPKEVGALRTTHTPPPDRSRVLANFVGMLNNLHGIRPPATCNYRLGTADSPRPRGGESERGRLSRAIRFLAGKRTAPAS